jgi:hypothetical protein
MRFLVRVPLLVLAFELLKGTMNSGQMTKTYWAQPNNTKESEKMRNSAG